MISPKWRQELAISPSLVEMLETGTVHAKDGTITPLHSASTLNNLVILKRLFDRLQATATLEIGLGYGASCALFAACHRAGGAPPARQHVGIDPLQDTLWKDATPRLLERDRLEAYVEILRRTSSLDLPALVAAQRKFDLIYVDGSHLFEDVFVDFYFCRQLLKPGGIIGFDDCSSVHIAKVLKFITTSLLGHFEEVDVSPLRLDGGTPWKYRVASILGKTQFRAFRLTGNPEREQQAGFVNF